MLHSSDDEEEAKFYALAREKKEGKGKKVVVFDNELDGALLSDNCCSDYDIDMALEQEEIVEKYGTCLNFSQKCLN